MNTAAKLIEGVTVNLGGEDYIIPPLNLKAVRRLMPKIEAFTTETNITNLSDEMVESMADIVHTALTRNYPDITREQVEEIIDLKNMKDVIGAVLGVSGFVKGGQQPGEVQAVQSIST